MGVRSALGSTEELSWSGGFLLILASYDMFFMRVSHHFIILMILVLIRGRGAVGEWIDVVGIGVDVCMIRNRPSGNSPVIYFSKQWFCSATGARQLFLIKRDVLIWKGLFNHNNLLLDPTNIVLVSPEMITPA